MIHIMTGKSLAKLLKRAYERGMAEGRCYGYRMDQADKSNRGIVLGSEMDREIDKILKEKFGGK